MFNGVVLGGIGRIVSDPNLNAEFIRQGLEFLLEDVIPRAVAPATITEQQQGGRVGILELAIGEPPVTQRITGKLAGVVGGGELDKSQVEAHIIKSMGNGHSSCQTGPVMVVDLNRLSAIEGSVSIELT